MYFFLYCYLGPEYGTTEAAWKGVLVESDRLCDLHLKVKDNLTNDVIQQVKTWQKDTYHKVRILTIGISCKFIINSLYLYSNIK